MKQALLIFIMAFAFGACSVNDSKENSSSTSDSLILKISVDLVHDSSWVLEDEWGDAYYRYLNRDSISLIHVTADSAVFASRRYVAKGPIGRELVPVFSNEDRIVCIRQDVFCFAVGDTARSAYPLMMKITIPDSLRTPKLEELAASDTALVWSKEWGVDSLLIGVRNVDYDDYHFYDGGFSYGYYAYRPMPAGPYLGGWSLKAVRE